MGSISWHLPAAATAHPPHCQQGSHLRGNSRGDLQGAKCTSQLYCLPPGRPCRDPSTAKDGCCEKQLLPRALRRRQQGSHRTAPCLDRQESVSSLGSLFNLGCTYYFLNRKPLSSYHHYNVCLCGYIAFFIIIHP